MVIVIEIRRFGKPTKTMAAASRFVEISKNFLDNLLDNSISEKTKRATKYGMKIFNGKCCCCCCCFLLDKTTNFFINSKQIKLYFPR